jgi:hypothetical protein
VSDEAGRRRLRIAGGLDIATARENTRLATIDTSTLVVHEIAPLTRLDDYYPELSGDGAGGLYGYFLSTTYPSRVRRSAATARASVRLGTR